MNVELEFSKQQIDLINPDLERVAIVGGKGSGKTFAGTYFVLNCIAQFPNSRGLLLWNSYPQSLAIWNQDIKPALQSLAWRFEFNEQKMILKCNGCEIYLKSADLEVMENVESVSFHWGWGDEVSFWPLKSFETFTSRIRIRKLNDKDFMPLVRVTSMPDEPDSWLYQALDRMAFTVHEIGLKHNPDAAFAANYERTLRSIYEGQQLKRYLDGERVSVAGQGLFAVSSDQQGSYPYDPAIDVLVSWDFNNEYRAVTWWQKVGKDEQARDIIACVRSFQMKCTTVHEDAEEQAALLKGHETNVYLTGDASGENKTAAATGSMWKSVQESLYKELPSKLRNIVPRSNPLVKDTIEAMNWGLSQGLIKFDQTNARKCFLSLSACRADKHGEIDKSVDYKLGAVRTHEADTARYAVWHYMAYLYPGSRNHYFVV